MLLRSTLAFVLVLLAAPLASAQGGLTATPNPYDATASTSLAILNATAESVTFDSLRVASTLRDESGGSAIYLPYQILRGDQWMSGVIGCTQNGPCVDYGDLFGWALAPTDSVTVQPSLSCPTRSSGRPAGGVGDTLLVYSGGSADRLVIEINSLFCVASEPAPEALTLDLTLSPNPTRSFSVLALALPALGSARIVAVDALGREVAVLHDGPSPEALTLRVDTSAWPVGLYVVRASAGERAASVRLVVVR